MNPFAAIAFPRLIGEECMMLGQNHQEAAASHDGPTGPTLDELARVRLGRQVQALYEPVIDEPLDPRLAELMRQLDADRKQ